MELLPAPLGPMIARTSWLRTSNETPLSAFTPPKASDTPSTDSRTSPVSRARSPRKTCGALTGSGRPPGGGGREGLGVGDLQIGGDLAGTPVLVAHLSLDMHGLAAVVKGGDQRGVLFADVAPAHLARARELLVVGVELLVQDDEAVDLRISDLGFLREVGIHLLDALADQRVDLLARGEIDVAGIRQVALFRPVAHRLHVDIDEGADLVAFIAEAHGFFHIRKKLQLVLEVLGGEQRTVGERADVLGAIDDLEMAVGIDVARVAGVEPALGVLRLAGRLR